MKGKKTIQKSLKIGLKKLRNLKIRGGESKSLRRTGSLMVMARLNTMMNMDLTLTITFTPLETTLRPQKKLMITENTLLLAKSYWTTLRVGNFPIVMELGMLFTA